MTSRPPRKWFPWQPPPRDELLAAFDTAFAARPEVVTLTIILKLLTQRGTEALLDSTRMRVTNMLHDVTARFFHDLEQIETGETSMHLVDAIIDLLTSPVPGDAEQIQAAGQFREALSALLGTTTGTGFVQALIASTASAEPTDLSHNGWALLRCFLEQWYTNYADKKSSAPLRKLPRRPRR